MPRGGKRPGAGRKPNFPRVVPPAPPTGRVGTSAPPTTNDLPEVEEFDAPDDLGRDERAVWMQQAPFAFRNRTLTRASALSFERYCRIVVMERNESKSSAAGGSNHRGLLRQINAYELQFLLTPCGKPMPDLAKVVTTPDEDDAFFGGPRGVAAR